MATIYFLAFNRNIFIQSPTVTCFIFFLKPFITRKIIADLKKGSVKRQATRRSPWIAAGNVSTIDARAVELLSPTKAAAKLPSKKKDRGTGDGSGGRTSGSKKRTASTDASSSSRAIVLSQTPLSPKAQATDANQGGSGITSIILSPVV